MMQLEELRAIIDRLDLRQAALAALIGKTPRTIRYWLSGSVPVDETSARLLRVVDEHVARGKSLGAIKRILDREA